MKKYKENAFDLFKNLKFILPVIFIAILGYGYLLTHSTVNVDTLSADRYFEGSELIGQSRLLAPILDKLLGIMNFYPFFVDFIAVVLLIIAGIVFCSLFKEASNGKIKNKSYVIFTCFFITYPLLMEVFTYVPMGLSISIGFILIGISLMLAREAINKKKYIYLIISSCAIWGAVSLYEAFACVYVLGVFLVMAIEIIYLKNNKKIKDIIKTGIIYAVPLIIGILINYIFATWFRKIFNIPKNEKAYKNILYEITTFGNVMQNILHTVLISYVFNSLGYLPITYLMITFIISIIMAIILAIKNKNISILIVFFGMQISLLLLTFIQGNAAIYRTCQQFQVFVAFIFLLLSEFILNLNIKINIKKIAIGIICLMLFYQVKDLYHWQYLNDIRYQKEKADLIAVANELLANYDVENKPVIFIGEYDVPSIVGKEISVKPNSLHEKVLKWYNERSELKIDIEKTRIAKSNVQSYVLWAMYAHFEDRTPGIELIKYFKYLGYDFKVGTMEMFVDAYMREDLPRWPREGSIFETKGTTLETDEFIVVNF